MPQPTTSGKRGRPPGTGKNDTDRLLKIAALMAADPALKPTTAIKQIGETDPSTIRRLRDKYNEQQTQLITATVATLGAPNVAPQMVALASPDLAAKEPKPVDIALAVAARETIPTPRVAPPAVLVALSSKPAMPTVTRLVPVAPPEPTPQAVAREIDFEPLFKPAPVQDPFMVLGKWFGNGIETAAVLFEQQMMFAQTMLKATPVKAMWRQQIVATEYLLMLSGPGQRIAATTPPNNG
jgi:hypothetical protein